MSHGDVYDLTGLGCSLPLALSRKEEKREDPQPAVTSCSECGVRYFARPKGSPLAENGMCRACCTSSSANTAAVTKFDRRRSRRAP